MGVQGLGTESWALVTIVPMQRHDHPRVPTRPRWQRATFYTPQPPSVGPAVAMTDENWFSGRFRARPGESGPVRGWVGSGSGGQKLTRFFSFFVPDPKNIKFVQNGAILADFGSAGPPVGPPRPGLGSGHLAVFPANRGSRSRSGSGGWKIKFIKIVTFFVPLPETLNSAKTEQFWLILGRLVRPKASRLIQINITHGNCY